ncbi:methyltransferase, FxLD system [Nocardioides speluncae]|uniref:methyltransferase, FxLD system n=1 Tax=Nocardioides speluncae TaxID=2670337 RepID=UPI00197FE9A3|nr:methyltransferase, FxLD system [Nocardioides speluncae]
MPPSQMPSSQLPLSHWKQATISFPDRATADRIIADVIAPALIAATTEGHLHGWWYLNKQPWRLRYLAATNPTTDLIGDLICDPTGLDELLDGLAATGRITGWSRSIYEPETYAFGGEAAMAAAHTLFHHDSRHLLTYDHALGAKETMVLLSSAMMRAAGLDTYEQGDVWHKVTELRPPPTAVSTCRAADLSAAMRRLMRIDARGLCRPGNPLAGHHAWVTAFEKAGTTLGELASSGHLTRGLRAVTAHHLIFHANRAGLSLADQSTMSALAREAIMGTNHSDVSSVRADSGTTSVGRVNSDTTRDTTSDTTSDTASESTADSLRQALVDKVVAEGRVRTPAIKQAMQTVPRHLFVPGASLEQAYANSTVDIKHADDGASISCASQPGIVGLMLEQLQVEPGHNVLELGAGTGYNAGLLAHLTGPSGHVTTIDVDDDLVTNARAHLSAAGTDNVTVVQSDGALGYPDAGPYDRIIATVGAHGVPHAWLDQLAPGGRLLVPQRLRGGVSRSISYEHHNGAWVSVGSEMNTFMPLRDGVADDHRHLIPLAANGSVHLRTHSEQTIDPDALDGVVDQPRTVTWAEVYYQAMESPEWMELWLTCTLPDGLNRMPFSSDAVGTALVDQPYSSSTAVVDKGALTYLTRRLSDRRTADGGKLWEFGVVAHGPGSDDLARRVTESMQTWDRDYRGREARFELTALDTAPPTPAAGRFSFATPLNRLVIDWQ